MKTKLGTLLAIAVLLAGCANGYEKFYQPVPPPSMGFAPFTGDPQLTYASAPLRETVLQMFRAGYGLTGVSDFTGPAQNPAGAVAQAKKVGAAVIVISQRYQNTVSGAIPITTPTSTTSYTSGTANIYGTAGMASGNYSGTTTTYGSQTNYIPYSIDRYEQAALYFAPIPRRGPGIIVYQLTDTQRQQLGTNQALQIGGVRDGSPAFLADVLPGDYLFSIDGVPTYDARSLGQVFAQAAGHGAKLELMRSGQRMTKVINVPAGDW
jgi:hypothetical protein